MLTEKQRGVLRGMVVGTVVTIAGLGLTIAMPFSTAPEHGLSAALAHALKWDILLVGCLAANIGLLARHRFFTPADIDGGGLTEGTPRAQVLQSTLQNTLEQTVLGVTVHMIWAGTMPATWQGAVPAAAVLFLAGRLLFWRGYSRGAPARALGFALTFYPSVAMLVVIGGRLGWLLFQ